MNSFASTHSRATSSNSILPSKVRSAAVIYQTTPPTTMSPFCTPGVVDPSTYSEASSLTSSHQTTGMSSAVNFTSDSKSSSLQTSNDQHRITTNDSNLSSSDMRGIMNGKPPDMLFLPNDFLPAKKKLIDERHGYKIWTYAVHFDRSLPDKNPDGVQMQSFLNKIMHFYEDIYDNLTKCLLSHLMVGWDTLYLMVVSSYPHCFSLLYSTKTRANFYNLHVEGSSIDSIHTAVLSSSHILDDNYLVRVLDIMKHPHKKEWAWFDRAKGAIEKKFKVKFPDNKKHFLYNLSDHHFNKNPDDVQMQPFLNKIMHFYEDIYDNLTKCLLSHLMVGWDTLYLMVVSSYPHCFSLLYSTKTRANFYNLHVEGSSIDSIHTAVLSSSHILDDNYLVRVLDIMKHPHKKEWAWFDRAKGAIEKKFKVKFPDNKKHFLYKISDHHFNNTFNQRMRRGMLQTVGGVWYERIYPKNDQDDIQNVKSFTTLFQGPVVVEKKVIAVLGFPYNGYIVRRAAGVPRYLPTKDELVKAIQFLPEDQFAAQMIEYYRKYHAGKEVRGP
jgi:hypothetical protein